jgi:RNA-directed DNA polymerase
VRYADDLVVMCASRRQAQGALAALTALLAGMGLAPKASKTRIVHLKEGGEGFDFLGFHHRWVRARAPRHRHVLFLARWPSEKAMRRVRDRVRELTARRRLLLPVEVIVRDVNSALRGWCAYFRYGNSAHHSGKIRRHAMERLVLVMARRHHRTRAYGLAVVAFQSADQLGLINLGGIVVAPRPGRDWRGKAECRR